MQHERKRKKEARKKKRAEEAAAQAAKSDPAAVATANRQRAELELITRGEDSGEEQGFNMKAIEVGKKRKRAKKRGKKKEGQEEREGPSDDLFRVDTKDSRFSAVFDSHKFAIDPTDSNFKPTPAMREMMEERKR